MDILSILPDPLACFSIVHLSIYDLNAPLPNSIQLIGCANLVIFDT